MVTAHDRALCKQPVVGSIPTAGHLHLNTKPGSAELARLLVRRVWPPNWPPSGVARC